MVWTQQLEKDVPLPTTEVRSAIQRLKTNTSAGSDGIPAELLKAAGINFIPAFHQLLEKMVWTQPLEKTQNLPFEENRGNLLTSTSLHHEITASSALSTKNETRVTAKTTKKSAQHSIQNRRIHRDKAPETPLLRSKQLSRKTKVRLYHQLVFAVLLYGYESWSLTSADEQLL
uniref:Uncharacterized protein n=1 Tax=Megaselia scalaris TaxID=36166 RepID=T1GL34_MEGSC